MLEKLRARVAMALLPRFMKEGSGTGGGDGGGGGGDFSFFGPEAGFSPFGLGPERGAKDLLAAYSSNPWLRAVTSKIGKSVGTTAWRLRRIDDGPGGERAELIHGDWQARQLFYRGLARDAEKGVAGRPRIETVERHPLLDLLNRGNPNFPGQVALQVTQEHLDIVGEAFWLKERDASGRTVHLWPVPPTWVRDVPNRSNPCFRIDFHGAEHEVPAADVIVFKEPDPANPYGRGSGIARALADELETDEFAARHMRQTFQNRARPDFIVTPPDGMKLQTEQVERLKQSWMEKTRGVLRAGVPLFLPQSMKFTPISQTFENLQLIDLRLQGRDFTLQVYGMPPEKMGINTHSNRATIEGADLIFAKEVLLPRQDHLRAVLQTQLVPEFDPSLILDFESPVMEDRKHKQLVMKATPWAFTVNEHRARAGEASLGEAGEVFFVPKGGDFIGDPVPREPNSPLGEENGEASNDEQGT